MKTDINEISKKYTGKKVRVTMKYADDEKSLILVEGDHDTLVFLGELFLAHAGASDCGLQIGPMQAGSKFFDPKSTFGLYIHRLPCTEKSKK